MSESKPRLVYPRIRWLAARRLTLRLGKERHRTGPCTATPNPPPLSGNGRMWFPPCVWVHHNLIWVRTLHMNRGTA